MVQKIQMSEHTHVCRRPLISYHIRCKACLTVDYLDFVTQSQVLKVTFVWQEMLFELDPDDDDHQIHMKETSASLRIFLIHGWFLGLYSWSLFFGADLKMVEQGFGLSMAAYPPMAAYLLLPTVLVIGTINNTSPKTHNIRSSWNKVDGIGLRVALPTGPTSSCAACCWRQVEAALALAGASPGEEWGMPNQAQPLPHSLEAPTAA